MLLKDKIWRKMYQNQIKAGVRLGGWTLPYIHTVPFRGERYHKHTYRILDLQIPTMMVYLQNVNMIAW